MRDSSDRGEEHPRSRAAEALVRSVPTVGGDEADTRGVVPSAAIGDGWSGSLESAAAEASRRRPVSPEDPTRSGMDWRRARARRVNL